MNYRFHPDVRQLLREDGLSHQQIQVIANRAGEIVGKPIDDLNFEEVIQLVSQKSNKMQEQNENSGSFKWVFYLAFGLIAFGVGGPILAGVWCLVAAIVWNFRYLIAAFIIHIIVFAVVGIALFLLLSH